MLGGDLRVFPDPPLQLEQVVSPALSSLVAYFGVILNLLELGWVAPLILLKFSLQCLHFCEQVVVGGDSSITVAVVSSLTSGSDLGLKIRDLVCELVYVLLLVLEHVLSVCSGP